MEIWNLDCTSKQFNHNVLVTWVILSQVILIKISFALHKTNINN
jgi:hypothetical protein